MPACCMTGPTSTTYRRDFHPLEGAKCAASRALIDVERTLRTDERLDDAIERIEKRFDQVDRRFEALERRMEGLEGDMVTLRREMHNMTLAMMAGFLTLAGIMLAHWA